jgi:hypothetical protein
MRIAPPVLFELHLVDQAELVDVDGISGSNTVFSCCTIWSPTARIAGGARRSRSSDPSSLLRRHDAAFASADRSVCQHSVAHLSAPELAHAAEHGELAEPRWCRRAARSP